MALFFWSSLLSLLSLSALYVCVDAHATLTVQTAAAGATLSTGVHIGHGCNGAAGAYFDTTAVLTMVPAALRASTPALLTSIAMVEMAGWSSNYWIEANGDLKMRWITSDANALIGNTTRIGEFPFSLKVAASVPVGSKLVLPVWQFCTNNTMKLWNGSAAITVTPAASTTTAPTMAPTMAPTGTNGVVATTPVSQLIAVSDDHSHDHSWKSSDTLATIAIIFSILSLLVHVKAWFVSPASPAVIVAPPPSSTKSVPASAVVNMPAGSNETVHAEHWRIVDNNSK